MATNLLHSILSLLRSFSAPERPGLVEQVHQRKTITGKTVEARYWVRPEWNDAQKATHLANVLNPETKLTHEALARHNPTYTGELDVSSGRAPTAPFRVGAADLLEMLGESGDAGWRSQEHLDRHWDAHGKEGNWAKYYATLHARNTNMLNYLQNNLTDVRITDALKMLSGMRTPPKAANPPRKGDSPDVIRAKYAAEEARQKEAYTHLPFEATLHHHLFHTSRLHHPDPNTRQLLEGIHKAKESPIGYLQAPLSMPKTLGLTVHIPANNQTGITPVTTNPHNGVLVSTAVGIHDAPSALRLATPHAITAYVLKASKQPHNIPNRPIKVVKD